MKSLLILISFVFPILVSSQKCPEFQSVIPLNPSATSSNFSLAVVADGKYYLMAAHDLNDTQRTNVNTTGNMPKDFEDSRLISLIDRSDCIDSEYYLFAIKSLSFNEDRLQPYYSTLDLKNWNHLSKWSDPKLIWELPIMTKDPKIKVVHSLGPDLDVEDFIHSFFVWEKTKTMFVITKPILKIEENRSLNYYSIGLNESCHQNYFYSNSEKLDNALHSVIPGLDLCFVSEDESDSILYCFGGNSFQANIIAQKEFQNGFLSTEMHKIPERFPSISLLYPLSVLCNQTKLSKYHSNEVQDIETDVENGMPFRMGCKSDLHWIPNNRLSGDLKSPEKSIHSSEATIDAESEGSGNLWLIILITLVSAFIVLCLFVLIFLICTDRRRLQLARM